MSDIKAEYKIELDPVFQAKLAVLLETQKVKAPHAPASGGDMLNKATALGINQMLRMLLRDEPAYIPHAMVQTAMERAGDVLTLGE